MGARLPWQIISGQPPHVAYVAATVCLRVGVDDLAIETGFRHAEPITVPNLRRSVYDKDDDLAGFRNGALNV